MRNDRQSEIHKLNKQTQRRITWEKFLLWFDERNELEKLNFRAALQSEYQREQIRRNEIQDKDSAMFLFAVGILETLGVFL